MYQTTDKMIRKANQLLIKEFRDLRRGLASFDEINVLRLARVRYQSIYYQLVEMFLVLANDIYEENFVTDDSKIKADGVHNKRNASVIKQKPIGRQDIMRVLDSVNPVIRRNFKNEMDRMAVILSEEYISLKGFTRKDWEYHLYRLSKLIGQESIFVTDEMMLRAYKNSGVKKVRWYTQRDERVCHDCKPLDNRVFDIDSVPTKHPNCRCWLVPVFD